MHPIGKPFLYDLHCTTYLSLRKLLGKLLRNRLCVCPLLRRLSQLLLQGPGLLVGIC